MTRAGLFSTEPKERGTVLILVALVGVALVSFVALAIDTYRLASASTEKQVTADLAALSALEGYYFPPGVINNPFGPPPTITVLNRWNNAVARAEDIARRNKVTSQWGLPQLAVAANLEQPALLPQASALASGFIQAGIWWSATDCAALLGPCCINPVPPVPESCFEVCPGGDCGGGALASAMRVGLQTASTSEVELTYGKIFGVAAMPVASGGTASANEPAITAILPRHMMVLIDVGRGTVVDNTRISERNGGVNTRVPAGAAAQPSGIILDSAYRVMDEFQLAGGAKDMIGWFVYDSVVGGPPISLRTSNGLRTRGDIRIDTFRAALGPAQVANRGVNNLLPVGISGSNLRQALVQARQLLSLDPDFARAQNSIVIITSGMVDDCVGGTCDRYATNGGTLNRFVDSVRDLEDVYNWAVSSLTADVNSGTSISLSVIFTGNGAHFTLRQRGSGSQCMSEDDMRTAGATFTSIIGYPSTGGAAQQNIIKGEFDKVGFTTPFVKYFNPAQWLYSTVRAVGGSWLAVLPPCTTAANSPIDISNMCNSGGGAVITAAPAGLDPNLLSAGRLFCNPGGISEDDQTRAFLRRYPFSPSLLLVGK